MKRRSIYVDDMNMTVMVSRAFYRKACMPGTVEFRLFRETMVSCQGYSISFNPTGKSYHGLSFARMEEYIRSQPDSEARMKEFYAVRIVAKAKGAEYPLTKKWFLNAYPEDKSNEVSEKERKTLIEKDSAFSKNERTDNVRNFTLPVDENKELRDAG